MRKLNEPPANFCLKDCPYQSIVSCGNNIIECKHEYICQMWHNNSYRKTDNQGGPTREKNNGGNKHD